MASGGYKRKDIKYLQEIYQGYPNEAKNRQAWRQLQQDYSNYTFDEWTGKWICQNKIRNPTGKLVERKQPVENLDKVPQQLLNWHQFLKQNQRQDGELYRDYLKRMSVEYKQSQNDRLIKINTN
jgi:hypothetical protein